MNIYIQQPKPNVNIDDYEQDGLIYCGKCHTQKQLEVKLNGVICVISCLCKCETEKRDIEAEDQRKKQRMLKLKHLREVGFYDKAMQEWTFESDDGKDTYLIGIAKNYVTNFELMRKQGNGLLLYGTSGTGKTYAAACIVNALLDKGIPCMMTNFARISNYLWDSTEKHKFIDSLNKFELLVIDDISAERKSEYMNEIIFTVIDERYRSGLPLIATTNLQAKDLQLSGDITHDRIFSRLMDMCIPIEVSGGDRRKDNLIKNRRELKEVLGL